MPSTAYTLMQIHTWQVPNGTAVCYTLAFVHFLPLPIFPPAGAKIQTDNFLLMCSFPNLKATSATCTICFLLNCVGKESWMCDEKLQRYTFWLKLLSIINYKLRNDQTIGSNLSPRF